MIDVALSFTQTAARREAFSGSLLLRNMLSNRLIQRSRLSKIRSQGQPHNPHVSNPEDKLWSAAGNTDISCPVCLQVTNCPVQTNCGHFFCAPCLISYWKHCTCLDAISCPLCRQKVNSMCHVFSEHREDGAETEVMSHITTYNRRFSGAPRPVTEYLSEAPLLLLHLLRWLGNLSGLVWLFLLRVALCGFGAAMSLAAPLETLLGPLSSVLAVLDDFLVVVLLLICIINTNQQVALQRSSRVTQGVLTDTL